VVGQGGATFASPRLDDKSPTALKVQGRSHTTRLTQNTHTGAGRELGRETPRRAAREMEIRTLDCWVCSESLSCYYGNELCVSLCVKLEKKGSTDHTLDYSSTAQEENLSLGSKATSHSHPFTIPPVHVSPPSPPHNAGFHCLWQSALLDHGSQRQYIMRSTSPASSGTRSNGRKPCCPYQCTRRRQSVTLAFTMLTSRLRGQRPNVKTLS